MSRALEQLENAGVTVRKDATKGELLSDLALAVESGQVSRTLVAPEADIPDWVQELSGMFSVFIVVLGGKNLHRYKTCSVMKSL
jgi:hypothetical protein